MENSECTPYILFNSLKVDRMHVVGENSSDCALYVISDLIQVDWDASHVRYGKVFNAYYTYY